MLRILNTLVILICLFFLGYSSSGQQKDSTSALNPANFITDNAVNKNVKQVAEIDSVSKKIAAVSGDYMRAAIDNYMKDKYMKSPEFVACVVILFFATLICLAEVFLFLKGKIDSSQIIKCLIITLIIFAVLFLIASGYSTEQISPAFGLLGTIAGYLLGKDSSHVPKHSTTEQPTPNS
jgi:hypothetical protein